MNRIHPVEFVLKFEQNPLLGQILSKTEFPTEHKTFLVFSKDWINQSNVSGIQNITTKGLLEQSSFKSDSYKIFAKRFHLCFLKVPWVTISNKSNRNEEAVRSVQSLSTFALFCLKLIISTFLPCANLQNKTATLLIQCNLSSQ